MALVYAGLGSNLGDRASYINSAVEAMSQIPGIRLLDASRVQETAPVEFLAQPFFLNQIVTLDCSLDPLDLLDAFLEIEKNIGRVRVISKGPRVIDIDLLLYDQLVFNHERLVIPHPAICQRDFILTQLIELDPGLVDPVSGRSYQEVYNERCN